MYLDRNFHLLLECSYIQCKFPRIVSIDLRDAKKLVDFSLILKLVVTCNCRPEVGREVDLSAPAGSLYYVISDPSGVRVVIVGYSSTTVTWPRLARAGPGTLAQPPHAASLGPWTCVTVSLGSVAWYRTCHRDSQCCAGHTAVALSTARLQVRPLTEPTQPIFNAAVTDLSVGLSCPAGHPASCIYLQVQVTRTQLV